MSPSDEQRLARAEAAACRAEELAQFKRRVEDILTEFFVSHDIDDTVASLRALHPPALRPEIAKRILLLSLDRSDTDRELASRLLSACYGEVLTMLHMIRQHAATLNGYKTHTFQMLTELYKLFLVMQ